MNKAAVIGAGLATGVGLTLTVATLLSGPLEQTKVFDMAGDTVEVTVKMKPRRVDTVYVTVPDTQVKPKPLPLVWGPFHTPVGLLNGPEYGYTGTIRYGIKPTTFYAQLDTARKVRGQLGFAPTSQRKGFVSNGKLITQRWMDTFDLTWKTAFDSLKQCFADSTCVYVYMMDEPHCTGCWNGAVITVQQVDTLACFVKDRLGDVPVAVRTSATWYGSYKPKCVDVAWAQYEGKHHVPSGGQTPQQFRDTQVAAAKRLGLSLIMGINILDGGNGPCIAADSGGRVQGTFAVDPNPNDNVCKDASNSWYRYQPTAYEFENAMKVFLNEPYLCGVQGWKWSADESNPVIRDYFKKPDVIAASQRLSAIAQTKQAKSCKRAA